MSSSILVSLYALDTGIFTGKRKQVFNVVAATPPGMGAYPGAVDPRRWRVDVKSGELVEWQPPAPADDELCTWRWDAPTWSWVAVATLAARKAEARAPLLAELQAEDARAIRPMAELLVALADGQAPAAAAKTALQEINERKAALRDALREIDAAQTEPALIATTKM